WPSASLISPWSVVPRASPPRPLPAEMVAECVPPLQFPRPPEVHVDVHCLHIVLARTVLTLEVAGMCCPAKPAWSRSPAENEARKRRKPLWGQIHLCVARFGTRFDDSQEKDNADQDYRGQVRPRSGRYVRCRAPFSRSTARDAPTGQRSPASAD